MMRINAAVITLGLALCWVPIALAAAHAAGETKTIQVVIDGPEVSETAKKAMIELRIFHGNMSDAPPAMANIAATSIATDDLKFPMEVSIEVSKARIEAASQPSIGVLISSQGNILYLAAQQTKLRWEEAVRLRVVAPD